MGRSRREITRQDGYAPPTRRPLTCTSGRCNHHQQDVSACRMPGRPRSRRRTLQDRALRVRWSGPGLTNVTFSASSGAAREERGLCPAAVGGGPQTSGPTTTMTAPTRATSSGYVSSSSAQTGYRAGLVEQGAGHGQHDDHAATDDRLAQLRREVGVISVPGTDPRSRGGIRIDQSRPWSAMLEPRPPSPAALPA